MASQPINPDEELAKNPYWNPIYGNDETRHSTDTALDTATLGLAGAKAGTARERAVEELMRLGHPEFSPQGYQYAGDYNPEAYAMPESAQASLASDEGEGREAQLMALRRMLSDSDQSVSSQQALDRYQAQQDAAQFANSREQAIRQQSRAQGRLGGAADAILSQQAAQAGANQNLNAGMQAAQMAALQRLAGTQAYGALGTQARGMDQNLAFRNQQAINEFNMANTAARNAARMANVTNRNEAAQLNRAGRQSIMGANAERGDMISNALYGAARDRAMGISNALGGFAQGAQTQGAQQQGAGLDLIKQGIQAIGYGIDKKKE